MAQAQLTRSNGRDGSIGGSIAQWLLFWVALFAGVIAFCVMRESAKDIAVTGGSTEALAVVYDENMQLLLENVVIDDYSHAMERHPETAMLVRDCFTQKGAYATFQVEKNKRYIRICLIDQQTIGFQVVDIVGKIAKERTAYIKDNMRSIQQVLDDMWNKGYPRFKGPL